MDERANESEVVHVAGLGVVDARQALGLDLEARLFAHLAHDSLLNRFAGLRKASWKLPVQLPVGVLDEEDTSFAIEDQCSAPNLTWAWPQEIAGIA